MRQRENLIPLTERVRFLPPRGQGKGIDTLTAEEQDSEEFLKEVLGRAGRKAHNGWLLCGIWWPHLSWSGLSKKEATSNLPKTSRRAPQPSPS